ncbi:MAG: phosphotransferase family protein [Microscillaceae bacterium]|nr:phosphotransferase family protein [Microscillaceae bacterium]
MASLDEARADIRTGEELPHEALQNYLDAHFNERQNLDIRQFPGGHSNLTYLIRYGEREMVLRKPPGGAEHIKGGHDMRREFNVLSRLKPYYERVPQPILFCDDPLVIGTDFYLMERVRGIVIRSQKPEGVELNPAFMRHLSQTFIDNFVQLQQVDVYQSGLIEIGKPEGYVLRQIEGSYKRFQNVVIEAIPEVEKVVDWLKAHLPDEKAVSIIHNDYKFDNVIYQADFSQVLAVLDWEMATVGNPMMDLGMVLGYWVEPGEPNMLNTFATTEPGAFSRREVVEYYEEKSKRKVKDPVFYFVCACLKNGVVAQQLYYRYAKGFTKDERLGKIGPFVRSYFQYALEVIKAGRISNL